MFDACVRRLAADLRIGPLPLGFEAPMFVPIRTDPDAADSCSQWRVWEGNTQQTVLRRCRRRCARNRDGVVSYILAALRPLVPEGTAKLDWRLPLVRLGRLMLFEAFVTNQRKTTDTRHVEDARSMREPASFESSVEGMRLDQPQEKELLASDLAKAS